MLENTILKIGGLLQVGFGEAGAEIIGKNMSSGDGELNIMMPGSKVVTMTGEVGLDVRQEEMISVPQFRKKFPFSVTGGSGAVKG